MSTAAEMRAELAHLRAILCRMSDPDAAEAIRAMIDELESRAKAMDNGAALPMTERRQRIESYFFRLSVATSFAVCSACFR